jgi:hypothetical protein
MHIVHDGLFLLQAEVVFAPLDCAAPVRTGTGEVMLAMFVCQSYNALALSLCQTEVVWGFTVLVEMAWYLTIMAGVVATASSEASSFSSLWGGCASSEAVGLHLIMLTFPLAKLWVLPYKGPEVAGSVSPNEASSHLLLTLGVLLPLVFITKPLLPREGFEVLDVTVLAIKLVHPLSAVPKPNHVSVYPIVSQPLQSPVKGAVQHMGLGQEGEVLFIVDRRGVSSFNRRRHNWQGVVGLASSHRCFDGGLPSVVDGEPQVLGVDQLVFRGSVMQGNGESCAVHAWLAAEPPFSRGHVIVVII